MDSKTVVVVGSGLAGLTASSVALDNGFKVILLDKNGSIGGNSAKATSGINAAGSRFQKGIDDSPSAFKEDILKSGKGECTEELVDILAWGSASAVEYIHDVWGVALESVEYMGGASKPRCHRLPPVNGRTPPVGWTIVRSVHEYISNNDNYEERLHSKVSEIIFSESDSFRAEGVRLEDGTIIDADAVIIASGGYANSPELLSKISPPLDQYPTTNGWFSNGDMVVAGISQGINVKHIDYVQLHPTSFVDPRESGARTKFVAPEILRGVGGMLLDINGEPIVDPLATRDTVSDAIDKKGFTISEAAEKFGKLNFAGIPDKEQDMRIAILLMTTDSAERAGSMIGFYKTKGFMQEVDREVLLELFDILPLSSEKFTIGFVTPATHFCMGGLEIDILGRLKKGDMSISNVFGAGEVTGGVHGKNRLGGNGCLESLVFGRWAAMNVSAEIAGSSIQSSRVVSNVPNGNISILLSAADYQYLVTSDASETDICDKDKKWIATANVTSIEHPTQHHIIISNMTVEDSNVELYPGKEIFVGSCSKRDEL